MKVKRIHDVDLSCWSVIWLPMAMVAAMLIGLTVGTLIAGGR